MPINLLIEEVVGEGIHTVAVPEGAYLGGSIPNPWVIYKVDSSAALNSFTIPGGGSVIEKFNLGDSSWNSNIVRGGWQVYLVTNPTTNAENEVLGIFLVSNNNRGSQTIYDNISINSNWLFEGSTSNEPYYQWRNGKSPFMLRSIPGLTIPDTVQNNGLIIQNNEIKGWCADLIGLNFESYRTVGNRIVISAPLEETVSSLASTSFNLNELVRPNVEFDVYLFSPRVETIAVPNEIRNTINLIPQHLSLINSNTGEVRDLSPLANQEEPENNENNLELDDEVADVLDTVPDEDELEDEEEEEGELEDDEEVEDDEEESQEIELPNQIQPYSSLAVEVANNTYLLEGIWYVKINPNRKDASIVGLKTSNIISSGQLIELSEGGAELVSYLPYAVKHSSNYRPLLFVAPSYIEAYPITTIERGALDPLWKYLTDTFPNGCGVRLNLILPEKLESMKSFNVPLCNQFISRTFDEYIARDYVSNQLDNPLIFTPYNYGFVSTVKDKDTVRSMIQDYKSLKSTYNSSWASTFRDYCVYKCRPDAFEDLVRRFELPEEE